MKHLAHSHENSRKRGSKKQTQATWKTEQLEIYDDGERRQPTQPQRILLSYDWPRRTGAIVEVARSYIALCFAVATLVLVVKIRVGYITPRGQPSNTHDLVTRAKQTTNKRALQHMLKTKRREIAHTWHFLLPYLRLRPFSRKSKRDNNQRNAH